MTRYFYDCEFIDDGRTIDLISIGVVSSDGREYYAQSVEFNMENASQWVKENVILHLSVCPYMSQGKHKYGQCADAYDIALPECPWRTRKQLKRDILSFMDIKQYGKPELWGYYSAYDHVVFCQLFGTMMDLPQGYPYLTYDLRQWLDMQGMHDVKQPDDMPHNALEDARWIAQTYMRVSTGSGRS